MKKLVNLKTFKVGDIVSGRHTDGYVYSDAEVKKDKKGKYIEFEENNEIFKMYLDEFYHLIKR